MRFLLFSSLFTPPCYIFVPVIFICFEFLLIFFYLFSIFVHILSICFPKKVFNFVRAYGLS